MIYELEQWEAGILNGRIDDIEASISKTRQEAASAENVEAPLPNVMDVVDDRGMSVPGEHTGRTLGTNGPGTGRGDVGDRGASAFFGLGAVSRTRSRCEATCERE